MADNITLPGTGSVVGAADKSSVYYQRMQLDLGGSGAFVAALGDSAGKIYVRPTPNVVRVQVTPTITTGAYTSGDNLGGIQEVANAARASGGSGQILSITILDRSAAQRAAMDLIFFDRTISSQGADNAAFAASDADMAYCLGIVAAGPYQAAFAGTLNSISTLINVGLPFVLSGTSLFCQAVVRGTPTYAVGDLTFSYTIVQD